MWTTYEQIHYSSSIKGLNNSWWKITVLERKFLEDSQLKHTKIQTLYQNPRRHNGAYPRLLYAAI